jgi:hypothetical protein
MATSADTETVTPISIPFSVHGPAIVQHVIEAARRMYDQDDLDVRVVSIKMCSDVPHVVADVIIPLEISSIEIHLLV